MDQRLPDPAVAAPPNWRGLCEELADKLATCWPSTFDAPDCLTRARAALAQPEPEGRPDPAPAGERQAAPVPVPASERLPGAEDCDSHGWCWVLYSGHSTWTLEPPYGQDGMPTGWTHWLPANALPLPSGEVQP